MHLWANFQASDWPDIFRRAVKTAIQVSLALLVATNLTDVDISALQTIGVAGLTAGLTVINNALAP